METKVIKTDTQYQQMLTEAEHLVALDPTPGTRDADRLELLTILIEDFEKRNFPFDLPDPIQAIEFRMAEQGLRQIDLAPLIGSRSRVSEVLARKRPLSVSMIRSLSKGLGIPLEILLSEKDANKASTSPSDEKYDWEKFPVKEMIRRGWITPARPSDATESDKKAAEKCLKAFLKQAFDQVAAPSLFRRSFRGDYLDEKGFYSTLAWTARVLVRAKDIEKKNKRFDPASLNEDFFVEVAQLSRHLDGPKRAVRLLATKGIVLVIEPKLPNTLLDGAAMLSESGTPVIGMTLRYDRVDYFWFTLLHELAHVWKHLNSSNEAFIDRVENTTTTSRSEMQANRIARDALIPRAIWKRSAAFLNPTKESVIRLANDLGIHPAIIVGRLQRELEKYEMFRDLLGQDTIRVSFSEVASF